MSDSLRPHCSLPSSSVHGISQAKILKWVAISFSRGSSWPRDRTQVSCVGRWILYQPGKPIWMQHVFKNLFIVYLFTYLAAPGLSLMCEWLPRSFLVLINLKMKLSSGTIRGLLKSHDRNGGAAHMEGLLRGTSSLMSMQPHAQRHTRPPNFDVLWTAGSLERGTFYDANVGWSTEFLPSTVRAPSRLS